MRARRVADAWCAAFLTTKAPDAPPITQATLEQLAAGNASDGVVGAVDRLAARYRLFHWHLEFPEIFRVPEPGLANTPTGWTGGFSAMLGNPPWDTLQMSQKEFFASREPAIANAKNAAARKRAIAQLAEKSPALFAEFNFESRRGAAETHLIRNSDRFPLCATGKINTYSIFAEHFRSSIARSGNAGIIVPTGIVTDATTQAFARASLPHITRLLDFRNAGFFEAVASAQGVRFCVLGIHGSPVREPVRLSFRATSIAEALEPARTVIVSAAEIESLNPNTGTVPIFLSMRDAKITLACYRRHPVLIRNGSQGGNPWTLRFSQGLFNMASDSELFRTADDLERAGARFDGWAWERSDERWLPLYEAKMLNFWQHRHGTYEGYALTDGKGVRAIPTPSADKLDDPSYETQARYWVRIEAVDAAVPDSWDRDWLIGWRDIATSLDVRTFVTSVLPKSAVNHKFPLAFPVVPDHGPLLHAVWSSLVFDYIARQKLSGAGMSYFIVKQLACPTPATFGSDPGWAGKTLGWLGPCRWCQCL